MLLSYNYYELSVLFREIKKYLKFFLFNIPHHINLLSSNSLKTIRIAYSYGQNHQKY